MKKSQVGFTLIELMIVVAMIGILAAVGMASFNRYIYSTKLQEREVTTSRIIDNFEKFARWDSSAQVGDGFHASGGTFAQNRNSFTGWTPSWTTCLGGGKCTGTPNWDQAAWKELKFGLTRQGRTAYLARIYERSTYKRLDLYAMSDLNGDCPPGTWSGCSDYRMTRIYFYKDGRKVTRQFVYSRD